MVTGGHFFMLVAAVLVGVLGYQVIQVSVLCCVPKQGPLPSQSSARVSLKIWGLRKL